MLFLLTPPPLPVTTFPRLSYDILFKYHDTASKDVTDVFLRPLIPLLTASDVDVAGWLLPVPAGCVVPLVVAPPWLPCAAGCVVNANLRFCPFDWGDFWLGDLNVVGWTFGCVFIIGFVAVSYTHLTLPTTPYV